MQYRNHLTLEEQVKYVKLALVGTQHALWKVRYKRIQNVSDNWYTLTYTNVRNSLRKK